MDSWYYVCGLRLCCVVLCYCWSHFGSDYDIFIIDIELKLFTAWTRFDFRSEYIHSFIHQSICPHPISLSLINRQNITLISHSHLHILHILYNSYLPSSIQKYAIIFSNTSFSFLPTYPFSSHLVSNPIHQHPQPPILTSQFQDYENRNTLHISRSLYLSEYRLRITITEEEHII